MKKIYNTPYINITEIKSDDVMVISGFRTIDKEGGNLMFDDARNEITKF